MHETCLYYIYIQHLFISGLFTLKAHERRLDGLRTQQHHIIL